jgi:hypothetical protein
VVDKNIKKVGETLMSVVIRMAKKPVEGDHCWRIILLPLPHKPIGAPSSPLLAYQ